MKKFLIVACLALCLTLIFAACTEKPDTPKDTEPDSNAETTVASATDPADPDPSDTDPADTDPADTDPADTDPADTDPADTDPADTDPVDPEPEAPYVEKEAAGMQAWSFDTFKFNGNLYFEQDGGSADKLAAQDNLVTITYGTAYESVGFRGWIGFSQAIESFGYYVDDNEFVYGSFVEDRGADGQAAIEAVGGEHTLAFDILVDLTNIGPGEHKVGALAKLADGTVARLYEITLVIEGLTVDNSMKFHTSIDHVNGKGPNGAANFAGRGGNSTVGVDVMDAATEGITLNADFTLSIGGWMGLQGGVNRYVWSVDGVNWYDAVGGYDGEPLPDHYAGIGLTDALKNGMFNNAQSPVIADLTAYNGQTVDVTFAAVSEADQMKVVPFVTIRGLSVPKILPAVEYPEPDENGLSEIKLNNPKWDDAEQTQEGHDGVVYGEDVKTFGQHFVIPEGANLTKLYFKYVATYTDGNTNKGTIKFYRWNTDYATSVAGTPLYEAAIENHVDCASMTFEIPADVSITGDIVYEITYTEGTKCYAVFASNGDLANVESYAGGNLIAEGKEFICRATVSFGAPSRDSVTVDGDFADWADKAVTEIPVSKFIAWTGTAPEAFTLKTAFSSDGEYLYVYLNPGENSGVTMYQICLITDNTVASDAAQAWYNVTFADGAATIAGVSGACKGEPKISMTGTEVEAAIPIAAIYGEGFALPAETRILLVAQINGGTHMGTFHDGKNPNDDGWADRTGDGCPLTLNADGTYTIDLPADVVADDGDDEQAEDVATTVLNEATSYVFWEEGCGVTWNKTSFGHKFTVADGFKVTSIATGEILAAPADYVIKVYEWKGNYADTVSAEALLTRAFNNGADNAAWTVNDIDVELSGDLYWELTRADGSASVSYFVSEHSESKGLGATYIDGAYSSNDAKCTVTLAAK